MHRGRLAGGGAPRLAGMCYMRRLSWALAQFVCCLYNAATCTSACGFHMILPPMCRLMARSEAPWVASSCARPAGPRAPRTPPCGTSPARQVCKRSTEEAGSSRIGNMVVAVFLQTIVLNPALCLTLSAHATCPPFAGYPALLLRAVQPGLGGALCGGVRRVQDPRLAGKRCCARPVGGGGCTALIMFPPLGTLLACLFHFLACCITPSARHPDSAGCHCCIRVQGL